MIEGGLLTVTLALRGGRVHAVLDAPEPPDWSRAVIGRPAAEAARIAGLLAESDSTAHEAAARAAFGLQPLPDEGRAIALESLRAHLVKFFAAWPRALGKPEATPPSVADEPEALRRAIFGPFERLDHIGRFEDWMHAAATPPACVMRHVWRRWDARWGRADLPFLREDDPLDRLDWRDADVGGEPVDASVAARVADADLMREIEARRGRGLAWRLAARIVEAARIIDALEEDGPHPGATCVGPGVGVAPAATGLLAANGGVVDGRVVRFAQVTPSDFALHANGLLSRILAAGPHERGAPAAAFAAMTLEAVDVRAPTRLVAAPDPQAIRHALAG